MKTMAVKRMNWKRGLVLFRLLSAIMKARLPPLLYSCGEPGPLRVERGLARAASRTPRTHRFSVGVPPRAAGIACWSVATLRQCLRCLSAPTRLLARGADAPGGQLYVLRTAVRASTRRRRGRAVMVCRGAMRKRPDGAADGVGGGGAQWVQEKHEKNKNV